MSNLILEMMSTERVERVAAMIYAAMQAERGSKECNSEIEYMIDSDLAAVAIRKAAIFVHIVNQHATYTISDDTQFPIVN